MKKLFKEVYIRAESDCVSLFWLSETKRVLIYQTLQNSSNIKEGFYKCDFEFSKKIGFQVDLSQRKKIEMDKNLQGILNLENLIYNTSLNAPEFKLDFSDVSSFFDLKSDFTVKQTSEGAGVIFKEQENKLDYSFESVISIQGTLEKDLTLKQDVLKCLALFDWSLLRPKENLLFGKTEDFRVVCVCS